MDMSERLPFRQVIEKGLADLSQQGVESVEALLVSIGAPRLRALGFPVRRVIPQPEHRLYDSLCREHGNEKAHSAYNALIRRLVSFERAAACGKSRR